MFGFLVHFDQTVQEGGEPQKPFQEGHEHRCAHDGDVYDLYEVPGEYNIPRGCCAVMPLTSFFGHGAVIGGTPLYSPFIAN